MTAIFSAQLIITFGLPGVGKTYVGKILEDQFGFFFYDGDMELTERMKVAIKQKTPFTDDMRDEFFERLIDKIQELSRIHAKLVVAQTFIKEKYREQLIEKISHAQFILVKADDRVREKRLLRRSEYPLDIEYSRQMVHNFEMPQISHAVIMNNEEGTEHIEQQFSTLFRSSE